MALRGIVRVMATCVLELAAFQDLSDDSAVDPDVETPPASVFMVGSPDDLTAPRV